MSNIKQVLVIRKDLKMRRGKECSQTSHASMAFLTRKLQPVEFGAILDGVIHQLPLTLVQMDWLSSYHTKVCLQVDSEAELMEIHDRACEASLEVNLITDAGLTEFKGIPTMTCLAIGPDLAEKIDPITKHLRLY